MGGQTVEGLSDFVRGGVGVARGAERAADVGEVLSHQGDISRGPVRVHVEFEMQGSAGGQREDERAAQTAG